MDVNKFMVRHFEHVVLRSSSYKFTFIHVVEYFCLMVLLDIPS